MKSTCCRSRPRCATCPVVLAARARKMPAPDDGDLFALLRAAPQRELPACVLKALEALDRRRFVRDDRLPQRA
jgi:ferredoxin